MLGIVLEMADFFLDHKPSDAILLSLPKIAFYAGAVYVITVYKLNIATWFQGPVLIIVIPFILMVVAKPAFIAASNMTMMRSVETQGEEERKRSTRRRISTEHFRRRRLSNTLT